MINDEIAEVKKELFDSFKNWYQINLESIFLSLIIVN